ncbi:MAG: extracellular solute-binding protein [Deltaproteobacteria bacterium]|nr:extracellular solute-binding protein [Deltaproteobacteria bacterium]
MNKLLTYKGLSSILAFSLFAFLALRPNPSDGAETKPVTEKTYEELVEGAKKEGKLIVWDTTKGKGKERFRSFEKKYPFIKIEQALVHSDEVIQKLIMESRAGRAPSGDVIACNKVSFELGKKEGVFMSFPWRKVFKEIPSQAIDKTNSGVGAYGNIWTMAYNTKLVAKEKLPKTYEDLLSPEWKGKLGADVRVQPWTYILAAGAWSLEKGEDYVRRLRENKPKFGRGGSAIAQLLIAGDFQIAPVYLYNIIDARATGAPIDWIPMEPFGGDIAGRIIPKGAPHPNAAVLYLGWAASPEGQKAFEQADGRALPYEGLGTVMAKMLAGKKLGVVGWEDSSEKALKADEIQDRLMEILGTKK